MNEIKDKKNKNKPKEPENKGSDKNIKNKTLSKEPKGPYKKKQMRKPRKKKGFEETIRFRQKDYLTDNYEANIVILMVITISFLISSYFFTDEISSFLKGDTNYINKIFYHLLIFYITYIVASKWFNPDLDIRVKIPGYERFPFKPMIEWCYYIGQSFNFLIPLLAFLQNWILKPSHVVINSLWRTLWKPIGYLFTHRGLIHAPIIGANVRIIYLMTVYYFFGIFFLGIDHFFNTQFYFPYVHYSWYQTLFENDDGIFLQIFDNSFYLTAYLAVIISDLFHIIVDFWDASRRGVSFFPGGAPTGLFAQTFETVFGIPLKTFIRYHLKINI